MSQVEAFPAVLHEPAADPARFAQVDRFIIPLGDKRIGHYFAESLFVAHSLRGRAIRRILITFPGALAFRERKFLTSVNSVPLTQDRITVSDYPGSQRQRSVMFLFLADDPQPAFVLKIRSASAPGRSLHEECNILRVLAPKLRRARVPQPLEYNETNGVETLLLEALPGRNAYVEMQSCFLPRRFVRRHFLAAARWIASFHSETRVEGRSHESGGTAFPLSASHGDFWARNLMLAADGEAAVVDWEDARLEAPPYLDLFHFPITYGLNYRWARGRRQAPLVSLENTFIRDNVVSRAVRTYFSTYCALRGIDRKLLKPLFEHYLMTRSAEPEEGGALPWLQFSHLLSNAGRSVFSG